MFFWHRDAVLYASQGNGRFANVTKQARLQGIRGTGLSALFFDYDRDGFPGCRSLLEPGYQDTEFAPRLCSGTRLAQASHCQSRL